MAQPRIEDHPDHFLVHGKERPYKVSKKNMAPGTIKRFQRMACGGVAKMADGGPTPDTGLAGTTPAFDPTQPNPFLQTQFSRPPTTTTMSPSGSWTQTDPNGNITAAYDSAAGATPIPGPADRQQLYDDKDAKPSEADKAKAETSAAVGDAQKQADAAQQGVGPLPEMHAAGVNKKEQQAVLDEGAAKKAELDAKAAEMTAMAAHQEATKASMQTAWEAGEKTRKEIAGSLDAERERYSKMEVDPQAYWKNHSKLTSSIGILLSSIGQGVAAAGGNKISNMALDIIQKQMSDELHAQEANIHKQGNVVAMWQQKLGNHEAAMKATEAHMWQMAGLEAQSIANKYQSPQVKAQGEYFAAMAREKAEHLQTEASVRVSQAQFQNSMLQYKAKAEAAAGLQALPGRTAAMLAPLDQAEELLGHMEKSTAVKEGAMTDVYDAARNVGNRIGVASGEQAGNDWERNVGLLANELGKISSGGVAGKEEAEKMTQNLLNASTSDQRKKAIQDIRNYIKGQKKGVTRTLNFQGRLGAAPSEPQLRSRAVGGKEEDGGED